MLRALRYSSSAASECPCRSSSWPLCLFSSASEPALPCPFDDLQGIVQQGQGLFNLPCDLTCRGEEGDIIGHPRFRPGGAVSARTAAQQRHSLRHIAIFDLDPAAKDRSQRTPEGETLLGRHRNQLVCPLIQGLRHLRRAKAAWRRSPSSQPKTADEPASEPRRLLRCSAPMPGPESRDRKGQSPKTPVISPGDDLRPDGQASRGRSDHKAQAPLPDATGMTQTCRQTAGFDRRSQ